MQRGKKIIIHNNECTMTNIIASGSSALIWKGLYKKGDKELTVALKINTNKSSEYHKNCEYEVTVLEDITKKIQDNAEFASYTVKYYGAQVDQEFIWCLNTLIMVLLQIG